MKKSDDNYQAVLLEDSSITSLPKPEILALDLDLTLHNVIKHYDESVNETLKHFGHESLTEEQLKNTSDNFTNTKAVSYTHLTLPTKRIV